MNVLKIAKSEEQSIITLRRLLHQYPEPAHKEYQTHKILLERLETMALEINAPVAGTGIVADLHGAQKGPTVAIRADMDALPITETTNVSYQSQNSGFMHACGHDAHMSMVFGAAKVLSKIKDKLNGSVRFIFQPAEEEGMPGGAKLMIEAGAMNGVSNIVGMHVWPELDEGYVGYRVGPFFAAPDVFNITIHGHGGHGAKPDYTTDPIVVTARVIEALQTIVSRESDPLDPVVVSIGSVHGGTAHNIIPDMVTMSGTVRTVNIKTRENMEKKFRRILAGITAAANASYTLDYIYGYPVMVTDKEVTLIVTNAAKKIVGAERVVEVPQTMGGEDFAYYLQKVPGTFLLLGVKNEKLGYVASVHTSKFNFNDKILPYGAAIFVQSVLELVNVKN